MEVGQTASKPSRGPKNEPMKAVHQTNKSDPVPQASDALPLPLYLTNGLFFTLFFSVAYFLLKRWHENIRTSTPLHVFTFSESLIAYFIYLLGFFGIDFVQSFISRASNEAWDVDVDDETNNPNERIQEDCRCLGPCPALLDCSRREKTPI